MKNKRLFPAITVTKKAEFSIKKGHPWVYDAEIVEIDDSSGNKIENGELTDIFSLKGSYLGTGFYNSNSKIRVRILSSNANEKFERSFYERRIRYAIEYRKTIMKNDLSCCRLIFGESDGLPGLTVDKFSDILVIQVLSYGLDKIKDMLYEILYETLVSGGEKISGIYERNDVAIRELEGLEQYKGWHEKIPHILKTETEICENGIYYRVDFENGQKTGFFLDQKYNRAAVAELSQGKTVLDCFTHTGSFALNAAYGGAAHVTAVDISASAIECAKNNACRNNLESKIDFVIANVFDLLPQLESERKYKYDFIILDPPAFTKSRKTIESAERGYKEINYRAMKLLPRGGYFATCSCSHFMSRELFEKMLKSAANDAGVSLRQIEARQQAPDHPILWNVPETDYLKFYIFQII